MFRLLVFFLNSAPEMLKARPISSMQKPGRLFCRICSAQKEKPTNMDIDLPKENDRLDPATVKPIVSKLPIHFGAALLTLLHATETKTNRKKKPRGSKDYAK